LQNKSEAGRLDGSIGENFDEYLFYLITQVQNRRVRDFTPALESLGLTISLWRALSTINRLGGCLMSELAEFTTTDRTTLTRSVDQLVELALVERCASPDDRRLVRVELTERGHGIFAQSVQRLAEHNPRVLGDLSPEELRTLRALLQRLLRNIVRDDALFDQVLNFRR
jgi:DNA-binding MarR family transcriptional regulator